MKCDAIFDLYRINANIWQKTGQMRTGKTKCIVDAMCVKDEDRLAGMHICSNKKDPKQFVYF